MRPFNRGRGNRGGFYPTNFVNPFISLPQLAYTLPNVRRGSNQYGPNRPTRSRGRGRGGRGRGRGAPISRQGLPPRDNAISGPGGSHIILQDTEMLASPTGSLQTFEFNPATPDLPRLNAESSKFLRYRIQFFNVAYKSASSTATSGAVYFGIGVGPKNPAIKKGDDILKLRPSIMCPVWKNESINVGRIINSQLFLYVNDKTRDGIAFTLYLVGPSDVGQIQCSYRIELAYPTV